MTKVEDVMSLLLNGTSKYRFVTIMSRNSSVRSWDGNAVEWGGTHAEREVNSIDLFHDGGYDSSEELLIIIKEEM